MRAAANGVWWTSDPGRRPRRSRETAALGSFAGSGLLSPRCSIDALRRRAVRRHDDGRGSTSTAATRSCPATSTRAPLDCWRKSCAPCANRATPVHGRCPRSTRESMAIGQRSIPVTAKHWSPGDRGVRGRIYLAAALDIISMAGAVAHDQVQRMASACARLDPRLIGNAMPRPQPVRSHRAVGNIPRRGRHRRRTIRPSERA